MTDESTKTQLHEIIDTLTRAQQRHLLEIARRWRDCVPTLTTPPVNRGFLADKPTTSRDQIDNRWEQDEP